MIPALIKYKVTRNLEIVDTCIDDEFDLFSLPVNMDIVRTKYVIKPISKDTPVDKFGFVVDTDPFNTTKTTTVGEDDEIVTDVYKTLWVKPIPETEECAVTFCEIHDCNLHEIRKNAGVERLQKRTKLEDDFRNVQAAFQAAQQTYSDEMNKVNTSTPCETKWAKERGKLLAKLPKLTLAYANKVEADALGKYVLM